MEIVIRGLIVAILILFIVWMVSLPLSLYIYNKKEKNNSKKWIFYPKTKIKVRHNLFKSEKNIPIWFLPLFIKL